MSSARCLPLVDESAPSRDGGLLRRDLFAGHLEAISYGGMVGFGETFLPAFALAAGLGEVTSGLVASVPMLAGGLMQMITPAAINRLASNRRWVMVCASTQALSFIPLVYCGLRGGITTATMFLVASVYWAAGLAAGPAWNTWMGAIVPRSVRARYFARRTRRSQAAVLSGFLVGGAMLQLASRGNGALATFAALFVFAAAFRLASTFFLSQQSEPQPISTRDETFSVKLLLRQFRRGSGTPMLVYLCVVQSTVQFAGPYFAPFMFQKLNFSYAQFCIIIAVSFLAKIISLPLWGHFAHRIGAFRLLWAGGIGIVPISAMWLVSDNLYWLMVVQLVGGVMWAAYELAFALLFFESIPERERTGVLTVYNLANTSAWVAGSLLGGFLLNSLGAVKWAYYLLFALSTVGRGFALLLLARVSPISVEEGPVGMRTIGLEPSAGSIDAPILPSLPDQAPVVKAEELVPVFETEQAA